MATPPRKYIIEGVEFILEPKSMVENIKFVNHLLRSQRSLSDAIDIISYGAFPEINKNTIDTIKNIIGQISKLEYNIQNTSEIIIYQLTRKMDYYYKLYYFKNRDEWEYIQIKSCLRNTDYDNDDLFLQALVKEGLLDSEAAKYICNITFLGNEIYKR